MTVQSFSRSRLAHAPRGVAGLVLAAFTLTAGSAFAASAPASAPAPAEASGLVAADGWIKDDMDRAIREATSKGKYLLIDFTGSDWCGWCIRLDNEVFAQAQFKNEAPRDFVMVALDFPRRTPQPEEVKRKNREWQQRLGVRGFPTIFLADAQGRPFARTGYRPGGPAPYMAHLKELVGLRRQQEQLIEAAMRLEGVERARGLGQALDVPQIMTPQKAELVAAIAAADPEDSLGLVARHGGGAAPAGKEEPAEKPRTPFQKDLEVVAKMIADGNTDEAASALRQVQQRYRPKGADLAEWAMVRMDFLAAIGKPEVAVSQGDRVMRTRDMPKASIQQIGHRKALMLLAAGKGKAALAAWDQAAGLMESELATRMAAERDAFAARCGAAGG
jgi:thiol-disulfide isomerase/thioredoxin